jgi:tetratricopeptide (TPR) repeat protein
LKNLLFPLYLLLLTPVGGKPVQAGAAKFEPGLKEAVKLSPNSFEANYNLGEFYFHTGRLLDGIPYMEKAQNLQPAHYVSGYDLALAYFETKQYPKARQQIGAMLRRGDSAELHSLLADVEEAAGEYVTAAAEYQLAARMEPSEEHIFNWGSELLAHQNFEAAVAVFNSGVGLFAKSAKLKSGLGIAFYLGGHYEEAVQALCSATDLNPSESWPYLFLGKMYNAAAANADEVRKRLARFAELQPKNAQALYYYALSLWARELSAQENLPKVEALLKRAAALDPAYSDAHLQLGIFYGDQRKYTEAIQEFQRAIALQPNLTTAHYHLAQAYVRTGEKGRAAQELQIFERLRKQDQMETERERGQVRQFIIDMKQQ